MSAIESANDDNELKNRAEAAEFSFEGIRQLLAPLFLLVINRVGGEYCCFFVHFIVVVLQRAFKIQLVEQSKIFRCSAILCYWFLFDVIICGNVIFMPIVYKIYLRFIQAPLCMCHSVFVDCSSHRSSRHLLNHLLLTD
ncbi:hypothetical protein PsorP6_001304 [Peronosclerospora sorghi]|uniref:Uncharacterized protein n=1 Tax=Peronosclerospora sorghi TaxID=230839 RepID=A0ACC0WTX4_9STRA|nr:hypothetical protein PsorP6_001304 [Peronosclerospora sorghi]